MLHNSNGGGGRGCRKIVYFDSLQLQQGPPPASPLLSVGLAYMLLTLYCSVLRIIHHIKKKIARCIKKCSTAKSKFSRLFRQIARQSPHLWSYVLLAVTDSVRLVTKTRYCSYFGMETAQYSWSSSATFMILQQNDFSMSIFILSRTELDT